MKALHDWLRDKRHSQRWLARQLGVSPAHICNLLQGKRLPSRDLILRLHALTRLSLTKLME